MPRRRVIAPRFLALVAAVSLLLAPRAAAEAYADRFVWLFGWNLNKDADVAEMVKVLEDGAAHGINGAVLSAGMDSMARRAGDADYFRRLDQVVRACARLKIELVPAGFGVGYGGTALAHDPHLAEGLPVTDAPFVVAGKKAAFEPDPGVRIANGDFEAFAKNRFTGFRFHDKPGEISFYDTEARHGGKASVRLENFAADAHGHGRVMQTVAVKPYRCYRVSLWVKTEDLKPVKGFQVSVLAGKRTLAPRTFRLEPTADWRRLSFVFNSTEFNQVNLYAGMWGGKSGKLWIDDWTIEEVGPINVLRRPGTPVTVRSDDGTVTFAEGTDYAPLKDPKFSTRNTDHDTPALEILAGGRIKDGQRLRVSWYHPQVVHESQVTVCMGEEKLYEIFDAEAKALAERLHPKRVLLNMDEVRMGGTCQACRGKDMGQLLGKCVTREVEILRKHIPGVTVYCWSDMFDPNHNAHGDYYLVQGSFAGSWDHVPKDLVMAVWGGAPREQSLRFFADKGFATLVGCYYDADDLKDVQGWLTLARGLPGVRGFMYTPWQKKYGLLGAFGDLVREQR